MIQIKEHGIYRRRDGRIVGPAVRDDDDKNHLVIDNCNYVDGGSGLWVGPITPFPCDLIEEIVVGEGWKPWNGGAQPCDNVHVELMLGRVDAAPFKPLPIRQSGKTWANRVDWAGEDEETHGGIIAYRVIPAACAKPVYLDQRQAEHAEASAPTSIGGLFLAEGQFAHEDPVRREHERLAALSKMAARTQGAVNPFEEEARQLRNELEDSEAELKEARAIVVRQERTISSLKGEIRKKRKTIETLASSLVAANEMVVMLRAILAEERPPTLWDRVRMAFEIVAG